MEYITKSDVLWSAAETQLLNDPLVAPDTRSAEKLLHELQVHQIELEMQNEQLRQTQVSLEESRDRYLDLFDFSPVGYVLLSEQGLITEANLTTASLLGVARYKLLSCCFGDFIAAEDGDYWYLCFNQLIKHKQELTIELALKDPHGGRLPVQLNCLSSNSIIRISITDISRIKQVETALEELKATAIINAKHLRLAKKHGNLLNRLQKIASLVPGVIYQYQMWPDGRSCFPYASDALFNLYRLRPEDVREDASKAYALIHPDDCNGFIASIQKSAQDLTPWYYEYRIKFDDGTVRWLLSNSLPQRESDGSTLWYGFSTDITERKLNEIALQESENRYRALLHNASDTILIANMDGKLEDINLAGEWLLGYSRNEILGVNVVNIHPADERAKIMESFAHFRENGCALGLTVVSKLLCKNGRVVDVEIHPSVIEVSGRGLVQGIFIDLTERKLIEKERLAKEKIHRDTLILEVHHRVKNNLQGIIGILEQFVENHPETEQLITQVTSQLQSIAVIHGLQGLADSSSVRVCELTVAIAATVSTLWQTPITVDIPEGWIACIINETEAVPLALVLNELISNAVKHGDKDGQVSITFSHEPNPVSIRLRICNTGLIPVGLGLGARAEFGTGLELVATLLPKAGAKLTWTQQDDRVVTMLSLDEPIIQLELSTVNTDEH